MNTKAFFPCGGGSNLILGTGTENQIFVYGMGRLCGGAHEISGIKAPLFLCGWVVGGFLGWVGGSGVGRMGGSVVVGSVIDGVGWMGGWCAGEGWDDGVLGGFAGEGWGG